MDEILHQDLVNLNRRYLHLVKQMAAETRTDFVLGVPTGVTQKIKSMSFDEIENLAEDMIAPCFSFNAAAFDQFTNMKNRANKRAFMANILATRMTFDAHN